MSLRTTGTTTDQSSVRQQVEQWLTSVVIGLELCPFAAWPYQQGTVRFSVTEVTERKALIAAMDAELSLLSDADSESLETTLLIIPCMLHDFLSFNDFLDEVDLLLDSRQLQGVFQVASFHPQYCFSGTNSSDNDNLTNRSPFPILHILREDSLEKVLQSYDDPEGIPERNIERMKSLSVKDVAKYFPYL